MTTKPESRLQRRIRQRLEEEVGGYWRKIHGGPFQQAGLPDLIGCVHGQFFGFEVKRPGLKSSASPIQEKEIEFIQQNGGIACVVESSEEAVAIVKHVLQLFTQDETVPVPKKRKKKRNKKRRSGAVHGAGDG